jgi:hypothetical protein
MEKPIAMFLVSLLCLASCVNEEEMSDTADGNFEALWKIIDEQYCFFDYKQQEYGLDWNAVHAKYKVRIDERMSSRELFEVMTDMLGELRDGHVNLSSAADLGRYWEWKDNYPTNFSDTLERKYLGRDYKIASGLKYTTLDDNIGYVRYESFQKPVGEGNLDDVLTYLALCRGLIIDIRNNGGGDLTTAELLAGRFVQEKTLVGYMQHKTGTGHNDFSSMEATYLEPSSNIRWHKPVCVLTNRSVYSAANSFAVMMHALPNVTLVGDHTGGGSGMPMSSSLPNGWSVRYSACPMYDNKQQHTEFGIAPDVAVGIGSSGNDEIIETARKILVK